MRSALWLVLALGACDHGCQRASEADDGRRMPKPPPSPSAEAEVRIEVMLDGAPVAPIDSARLAGTPPDYQDEERRAWKLSTLLGAPAQREGVTFAATGEAGVTVMMQEPARAGEPAPVLLVTRRGEAVVAMMHPEEPFPSYHGHGARLGRPGDPLPRIAGVTKIAVSSPPRGISLAVTVSGGRAQVWTLETLERAPRLTAADGHGDDRDAWSLRVLAAELVGKSARVTAITGDEGRRVIEAEAWADPARVPILRANRDGGFKFRWIEKDGSLGDTELRNVKALEVVP